MNKKIVLVSLLIATAILVAIYFLFFRERCAGEIERPEFGKNCCEGLVIRTGKLGTPYCVTPGTIID